MADEVLSNWWRQDLEINALGRAKTIKLLDLSFSMDTHSYAMGRPEQIPRQRELHVEIRVDIGRVMLIDIPAGGLS